MLTGASDSRRRDYSTALRPIESGRMDAERMVTRRFALGETEKAVEASADGEGVKVAVTP